MEHNRIGSEAQDGIHVSSKIHDFFDDFRIGTLLHQCGVRKRHGYSVRSLITAIFAHPFLGKNFFRGIVTIEQAGVGKDAAYGLLKGFTYNWRRLLLMLAVRIHGIFSRLTDDQRLKLAKEIQCRDFDALIAHTTLVFHAVPVHRILHSHGIRPPQLRRFVLCLL